MNDQQNSGQGSEKSNEPIFLLPASVAILVLFLLAIHAAYEFVLDDEGKTNLLIWFGFLSVRLFQSELPGGILPMLWTPVTHAFLHGSWAHVLLNVAWLAIFGTPVARRYGGARMFGVFVLGAIAGALLFGLLQFSDAHVLIGASGGVAGLTGAAMRFIFQPMRVARDASSGEVRVLGQKLATIPQMWANTRTRTFSLFWLGINLAIPIYDLFSGAPPTQIAWQAHIGGFVIGLYLPTLFERIFRPAL